MADPRRIGRLMATDAAGVIGQEVMLRRTNLGLTVRAAARLAEVSPHTQRRVERGAPTVRFEVMCRVAAAMGLKVWTKAFPVREPSLRDSGQLRLAEHLRSLAHPSLRPVLELGLGNGRAIDLAFFATDEIVAVEIYRLISDFQAQYRSADAKRIQLAESHQRPVRLVLALEDTRRNRSAMVGHDAIVRTALPAGSRAVLARCAPGAPSGRTGSRGFGWAPGGEGRARREGLCTCLPRMSRRRPAACGLCIQLRTTTHERHAAVHLTLSGVQWRAQTTRAAELR